MLQNYYGLHDCIRRSLLQTSFSKTREGSMNPRYGVKFASQIATMLSLLSVHPIDPPSPQPQSLARPYAHSSLKDGVARALRERRFHAYHHGTVAAPANKQSIQRDSLAVGLFGSLNGIQTLTFVVVGGLFVVKFVRLKGRLIPCSSCELNEALMYGMKPPTMK